MRSDLIVSNFMKLEPACVKGEKLELDMKNDVTRYIHLAGSVRTVCQVVQLQRRGEREKLDPRLHSSLGSSISFPMNARVDGPTGRSTRDSKLQQLVARSRTG